MIKDKTILVVLSDPILKLLHSIGDKLDNSAYRSKGKSDELRNN
jgi:hypothetical protein